MTIRGPRTPDAPIGTLKRSAAFRLPKRGRDATAQEAPNTAPSEDTWQGPPDGKGQGSHPGTSPADTDHHGSMASMVSAAHPDPRPMPTPESTVRPRLMAHPPYDGAQPARGPGTSVERASAAASPRGGATKSLPPSAPVMPAQEMAAHIMTLLANVKSRATDPELGNLYRRAERLFLTGNTALGKVLALAERGQALLARRGRSDFAQAFATLADRGYRDPKPALAAAARAIVAATGGGPGIEQSVLQGHLKALEAAQTAVRAQPDARADHLGVALPPLVAAIETFEAGRGPLRELLAVLDNQTLPLSDKAAALARVEAKALKAGPAAAGIRRLAFDLFIDFGDALALSALRGKAGPDGPAAQEAIRNALMQGRTAEEIGRRAIAVLQLAGGSDVVAVAQDALEKALRDGTSVSALTPSVKYAAVLDRYLGALTPFDRQYMADALEDGLSFAEAAKKLPTFHPYDLPPEPTGPARAAFEQDLAAATEQAKGFARGVAARVAAQVPEARAQAQALDAGGDTLARLQALQAQLTPSPAALNDNLSGRAFESMLSTRLIERMPATTKEAWAVMGTSMAKFLLASEGMKDPEAQRRVGHALRVVLRHRGDRPWDDRAPDVAALRALLDVPKGEILRGVADFLGRPVRSGHDVLLRAQLTRDVWLAIKDGKVEAPMQKEADTFYARTIAKRTGRTIPNARAMDDRRLAAPAEKQVANHALRATTGIMALHQPTPTGNLHAKVAKAPGLHSRIDVGNTYVAKSLARGGVTASGLSGTVSILVHIAEYARTAYGAHLPERDVLLGAAAFVVHDGGHSFYEALWVQDHFDGGRHSLATSASTQQSYLALKEAFSDVPEVQDAFAEALTDLAEYHGDLVRRR